MGTNFLTEGFSVCSTVNGRLYFCYRKNSFYGTYIILWYTKMFIFFSKWSQILSGNMFLASFVKRKIKDTKQIIDWRNHKWLHRSTFSSKLLPSITCNYVRDDDILKLWSLTFHKIYESLVMILCFKRFLMYCIREHSITCSASDII